MRAACANGLKTPYPPPAPHSLSTSTLSLWTASGTTILTAATGTPSSGICLCSRSGARNEIYARHGRRFKDDELQEYFNSKSWYEGTIDPDDFAENILSDIEIQNKDVIVEFEKENGYR